MSLPSNNASQSEFTPRALGALAASVVTVSLGPPALLVTFSLFMQPMSRDLHLSRAQSAIPVALIALGSAVMSPIIGKVVDIVGPRRVVLTLSILLGFASALLAIVGQQAWELYLLFGCIGLLNPGLAPAGRMIASWFGRRRALAYGLFGSGLAIQMPILLQVARPLIDAVGWRGAYAVFGAFVLLIAAPIILLWFREPDALIAAREQALPLTGSAPRTAWTSKAFWLIVVSLIFSLLVYTSVVTHGVAILTERGLSRASAATVLSALSIGSMVAHPVVGYLADRFRSPWIVAPFALAALLGLLMLHHVRTPVSLIIAAAILGLGAGGEGGTTQYWITRYFGLRHFSLIYGSIQPMTLTIAVAGGPLLLGVLYDRTGSYELGFRLLEGALLVSAVLIALLPPYVYLNSVGAEEPTNRPGRAGRRRPSSKREHLA